MNDMDLRTFYGKIAQQEQTRMEETKQQEEELEYDFSPTLRDIVESDKVMSAVDPATDEVRQGVGKVSLSVPMGLTTDKIVRTMCRMKKWKVKPGRRDRWFVIEGRTAYFDEKTGMWVCADEAFQREIETAFQTAVDVEMKRTFGEVPAKKGLDVRAFFGRA